MRHSLLQASAPMVSIVMLPRVDGGACRRLGFTGVVIQEPREPLRPSGVSNNTTKESFPAKLKTAPQTNLEHTVEYKFQYFEFGGAGKGSHNIPWAELKSQPNCRSSFRMACAPATFSSIIFTTASPFPSLAPRRARLANRRPEHFQPSWCLTPTFCVAW